MKKYLTLLFFVLLFSSLHAQYKVQFIVKEKTAIHHDSIYVAGTFNNWDSTANKNYLMHPYGENKKSLVLNLKAGGIRYKFHRGNWLSVEKQDNGNEVPDRTININKDTILQDSVERWRDQMFTDKWYALAREHDDNNRVKILTSIATAYAFYEEYYNEDSALYYAQTALQLQQKINASSKELSVRSGYAIQLINAQEVVATLMHSLGNYPKALELRLENLKLAEKEKDKYVILDAIGAIASDYTSMEDYQHVLSYGKLMDSILSTLNKSDSRYPGIQWTSNKTISTAYYNLGKIDSALYYAQKLLAVDGLPNEQGFLHYAKKLLGDMYAAKGENETAYSNYRFALQNSPAFLAAGVNEGLARLFQKEGRLDSALYYARQALIFYQTNKLTVQAWGENSNYYIAEISPLIADLYKANGQLDSAYKYLHLSVTLKDSLYNSDKIRQFQTLSFNEASRRQQLEQQSKEARQQYENKVRMYGLITIIAGVLIFAFILYRNNKHKQKANVLLQTQKQELENTLGELKITQKQLIQSEKMASLGELTAGIAHEIQNPLNFVNNFSEVSNEMLDEMKEELATGNEQLALKIADDVKQNLEKILHHGKRADAIVKGMLQHSRSSTGAKEPTDINALADEYLRLSYHGLRAKDKEFNATMNTDFDHSIGKIDITPQDIGRVLLNLYNNAFYAVNEKKKNPQPLKGSKDYVPTVVVSTRSVKSPSGGLGVILTVKDNGKGIPQKVIDKIFQPFFTTKPTGEGTGLGLSLSYDIIKAHGGEIKVETKEGEGTAFIIQLPFV